jgi:hypothetical protein
MAHQIPTSDARAIFVNAEDFRLTYELLTLLPESDPETLRTYGPAVVVASFALELYLKSILVDAGSNSVPGSHDLGLLYGQIPKTIRARIVRQWRDILKQWQHTSQPVNLASDLESILKEIGPAFEKWRYRHACPKEELKDARFTLLIATLQCYLLGKHPDWRDLDHSYFRSTFPVP